MVEIEVPEEDIIERMSGRRVHQPSGRSYHVRFNPPKVEGKDDVTGEDLIQRDDDREETVRNRLNVYRQQTRPLVDYYSSWAQQSPADAPKYRKISGVGAVEEIKSRLFEPSRADRRFAGPRPSAPAGRNAFRPRPEGLVASAPGAPFSSLELIWW